MSISDKISNNKAISSILLIAITSLGIGGNSLYNDTNQEEVNIILIESITDSKISKHEAFATPHAPYDVKFELLREHIDLDRKYKVDLTNKIDSNHRESLCGIQQIKDLYYKVPESDC